MIGPGASASPVCSRAGCRATPGHRVVWRNPALHSVDRRKVWLACDDHVDYLTGFLESRSFPVAVEPFETEPTG